MIVPMKKAFLFLQKNHARDSLSELASLGLLHVEHQRPPAGEEVSSLGENIAVTDQAVLILSSWQKTPQGEEPLKDDLLSFCHHVVDLQKRLDQLKEYSVTLKSAIDRWSPWGDFDPQEIKRLADAGVYVKFCQVPRESLKGIGPETAVKIVFSEGAVENCILVSRQDAPSGFKELDPPRLSLSQMRRRLSEDAGAMETIRKQLEDYGAYRKSVLEGRRSLIYKKNFFETLNGAAEAGELVYLKGYLPSEKEAEFVSCVKKKGWGIFTLDPDEKDEVPTLLRNPRWVAFIKPLLKLLELVPGYHELDISLLFIIFFSVFFGILIGDAGYGLVYFLLNLWVHRKFGSRIKDKSAFFLFYILSSCAMIWGLLTGTFFGQSWLLSLGIKPLLPVLTDTVFIQKFCFFLGALHLTLAHAWKGIVKLPSLSALADAGWICIIWAAFFLADSLILGGGFPSCGGGLIIAGLALVLFFASPQKNIFKAAASGLGTIALSLVNNFTDVVSYIRLFAVGLATVAIADAFNNMAAGVVEKGNFFTLGAAVLILICGHVLNIILGLMSVLVHGVRLNVLEFCSHLGVSWSGFDYKPFARETE
ncbi:MAG: hypothetical protein PHO34_02250 [Candidatus Omnitrophica bacterium]|nr:hypothetical protein [Candidatus Omnitrophota bacterium]MDD5500881.1 hypothetical protein [Candidatus Omnitrophota bacterium]